MNRSPSVESAVEQQDLPALKQQQLMDLSQLGLDCLGKVRTKPSRDIAASRIGVGFETLDRYMFDAEKVYPLLAQLGVKWARVQTGWSRCETTRGSYDFAWLEEIVDRLLADGVEPFFCLSFGNILYTMGAHHDSAVGFVPLYYGNDAVQAWQSYVSALARCFKDRIRYWEVWNEPNIPQFWHPFKPDPVAYTELVHISAQAVRKEHPEAKIVGGAMSKLEPQFLESALKAGLAKHIDAFSFHPYQLVPEDNLANMYGFLRRMIDHYSGGRAIEIWQGENGCPSQTEGHNDDWLGLYNTDQIVQAKWVARRILADLKTGFDKALYFHAADLMGQPYRQADGKIKKPVMMGLIHGDTYEPKYAFEVLQRVCSLFDEESVRQELFYQFLEPNVAKPKQSTRLGSPMAVSFVRQDAPLLVFWMTQDPQQKQPSQEIDLVFWSDSSLRFEQPVLVDFMTGKVFDVLPLQELFFRDGAKVGYRYRLPLPDYPLALTDASLFPHLHSS